MHISSLPNEIFVGIFSRLDGQSLVSVSKVCKFWKEIVSTFFFISSSKQKSPSIKERLKRLLHQNVKWNFDKELGECKQIQLESSAHTILKNPNNSSEFFVLFYNALEIWDAEKLLRKKHVTFKGECMKGSCEKSLCIKGEEGIKIFDTTSRKIRHIFPNILNAVKISCSSETVVSHNLLKSQIEVRNISKGGNFLERFSLLLGPVLLDDLICSKDTVFYTGFNVVVCIDLSQSKIYELDLVGETPSVLLFSNSTLIVGTHQGTIQLWDPKKRSCLASKKICRSSVDALHVSGKYLFSGTKKGHIHVLDLKKLAIIKKLKIKQFNNDSIFSIAAVGNLVIASIYNQKQLITWRFG